MPSPSLPVYPSGIITAAVTPLDQQLNVNAELLISHCKSLLMQGSDGIVLLGTTGEANSFSVDERMKILETLLDAGVSSDLLMVGTGCCAFTDTLTLTKHAMSCGVRNVLMLPPFFYKPVSDDALFAYFRYVIESVGDDRLNIYLYHIPANTGIDLTIELIGRLIKHYPDVLGGIKDSGGDWDHMTLLMKEFPMLRLYSGTEEYLLDTLMAGGAGCISATANVTVSTAADVVHAFRNGANPAEKQRILTALRNTFSGYPFVGAIKGFLAFESGNPLWNVVRPPNQILDKNIIIKIHQKFKQLCLPVIQ